MSEQTRVDDNTAACKQNDCKSRMGARLNE